MPRTLPERAQRRAVVEALAPWPPDEAPDVLASTLRSTLPISDAEQLELKAIIGAR